MEIIINDKKIRFKKVNILYIVVFVLFTLFVSKDLDYNTAFVDEAIYATVGEEALRGSFWERGLSWMGGSYIYPLISAFINRSLGLWGVRLFSIFTVVVAAVISGEIAKTISGSKARLITVSLFLFSSIAMNLAQLGTYDAPALLFFSLAFYLGMLSRQETPRVSVLAVVLSSILFSLAVMSKYIVIIFAPVVVLSFFDFKLQKFFLASLWTFVASIILGVFVYINFDSLYVLFTGSAFKEPTTHLKILTDTWRYLGFLIPLSIIGAGIALVKKRKHFMLILALIAGSLASFSYHFLFLNARSYWKHLVMTEVVLIPLVSVVLIYVFNYVKKLFSEKAYFDNASQLLVSVIILFAVLWTRNNFKEHWIFQRSWPSASPSLEFLQKNRIDSDIILAEGSSVYKYHLFAGFQNPDAWQSTWYVNYKGQQGLDGMKLAIIEKHFDFIVLNGYFTGDIVYELLPTINEYYDLAHTDTYKESGVYDRDTFVWVPKDSSREYKGRN